MKRSQIWEFDATGWLTNPVVMGMDLEEQGALIRMLCVQWRDGAVAPKYLPGLLGIGKDRIQALLGGLLGDMFTLEDGNLVNLELRDQQQERAARSSKARDSAKSRWSQSESAKPHSESDESHSDPDAKPKRKKLTKGPLALKEAIETWEAENGAMSQELQDACEEYRQIRSKDRKPVWNASQWGKNLGGDFTQEELTAAFEKSAASGWASVQPRKKDAKGITPGTRGNAFAELG